MAFRKTYFRLGAGGASEAIEYDEGLAFSVQDGARPVPDLRFCLFTVGDSGTLPQGSTMGFFVLFV